MIAVIAGTGTLPREACLKFLADQKLFFVICLFPEENGDLLAQTLTPGIEIITQECYKPAAILELLKAKGTTQLLFIGKVDKKHLLKKVSLDWLAIKLLGKLALKGDKDVMEALVAELSQHGIEVMRQDQVFGGLFIKPGLIAGSVDDALQRDIDYGMRMATLISQADIGQTVVVKDGMMLAVEAIEGTDACIKRGLELGGSGIVICKAAQPAHNKKYDLPTLGPATLSNYKPGDIRAVAWLSSHTIIAQKDEFIALANKLNITLVSM
jgi:UDP-2,3-diacylglucosamine hydrolase